MSTPTEAAGGDFGRRRGFALRRAVRPLKYSTYARRALALGAGAYLGWMFIRNGVAKFDPSGFWSEPFERWGYPVWLRWGVGLIETVGGASLVVPWLATWAGISVGAVMIGAAVTRARTENWADVMWILIFMAGCLWIAWEWRALRVPRPRED